MKKTVLIAAVIGFIVIAGLIYAVLMHKTPTEKTVSQVTGDPAVTIVRTDSGYEPNEVTIKKGDIVLWKNESKDFHWPASDLHPTHGIYPEFDPLRPLAPGEDWKFKFDKVGVWKFHDHIRSNIIGTVTVTE